jgi:UDP-3-O-[3-hydroxymyristoyl] glucosamine N-acyltransferase
MKDIAAKDFVIGSPAMPHLKYKKMVANTILLPKLKDRIKQLEGAVEKLSR